MEEDITIDNSFGGHSHGEHYKEQGELISEDGKRKTGTWKHNQLEGEQ